MRGVSDAGSINPALHSVLPVLHTISTLLLKPSKLAKHIHIGGIYLNVGDSLVSQTVCRGRRHCV